jgi:tRNA threonylcarbamoyladenosine biosynthesis protein TsaE
MDTIISRNAADTFAVGRWLAERIRAGDVVALTGELGAGKTCLVKGIAAAFGIAQPITSPTFTLIHEYTGGRLPLYHIDLYRVDSIEQALAIGIEDYLQPDGITVIEWAEKIGSLLPASATRVRLEITDETERRIEVA